MRAWLARDVPVVYLARMGYGHGRLVAIVRGFRALARLQGEGSFGDRLLAARAMVATKLHNSRILLLRYQRRGRELGLDLDRLSDPGAPTGPPVWSSSWGFGGVGAAAYFGTLQGAIAHRDLVFRGRNRWPPLDPINALLSFGYQVLWNHLFVLLELQGLDPYIGCILAVCTSRRVGIRPWCRICWRSFVRWWWMRWWWGW